MLASFLARSSPFISHGCLKFVSLSLLADFPSAYISVSLFQKDRSATSSAWRLQSSPLLSHHLESSAGLHMQTPALSLLSPPSKGSSRPRPPLHSPYLTCQTRSECKPLVVLLKTSHMHLQSSTFTTSRPLSPLNSSLFPHLAHISPKWNIWPPNQPHFPPVFS